MIRDTPSMTLRYPLLICIAAVVLSVAKEEFAVLVFAAIGWLGLVLAVRLRPSLASLIGDRRRPRATEWTALVIGLLASFITVIGLTLVLKVLRTVFDRPVDAETIVAWSLAAIWTTASVGPLWLQIRRSSAAEGDEAALGPCAAGLWAGLPLGLGLMLMQLTLIDPLFESLYPDIVFGALMAVPSWGLLVSAGLVGAFEALAGRNAVAKTATPVFIVVALLWAALAVAMAVDLAGLGPSALPRLSDDGGIPSVAYVAVTALAWATTLWRLRGLQVRNPATAAMIAVMLLIGGALSLTAPAMVFSAGDWAPLIALMLLPVLAITVAIVWLAVVPVLRWLNGERIARRTVSASA